MPRTLRWVVKFSLVGLLGGVVAALVAIVGNSQSATILAMGLVLASIEVMVLSKAASGFTPVVIPVFAVNSVFLSAPFLWDKVRAGANVSISLQVTEEYLLRGAVIGILFSASYTVGALLAGPRGVNISLNQLRNSVTQIGRNIRVPNGALVGIGYFWIFLTILAWQSSLLNGAYLQWNGPNWAVMLSNAFAPVGFLALSVAAAKPGPWRVLAITGIGLCFLILFGRATRSIAMLPAMVLLGRALASGERIRARFIILAAATTILVMQLALVGRGNQYGVGILPLGAQLFTRPHEIFSEFSLSAIAGNILISGPLTAVVSYRPIPSQALWISINPMPGSLAGWGELQPSLRLNPYTPYNALGELGAHGILALVAVSAVTGFILSLSTRIASNLRGAYALTATLLTLTTAALFSVIILQYNLRTTARIAWYALIGIAAISFAQGLFSRRRAELEDQGMKSRRGA